MQNLTEFRQKIELLMKYAVPAAQTDTAKALLEKLGYDRIGLNLLHHFYSYLPEGEDDAISCLRQIRRKQGVFLLCASSAITDYLYLVSSEETEFMGRWAEGIYDEEVLEFFNFGDRQTFLQTHPDPAAFPEYIPAYLTPDLCPVCAVAHGEHHILGCAVEVCPWCEGQLTRCNCRFSQVNQARLNTAADLDLLQQKIEAKGRIPYDSLRHRPAYPTDGSDLDKSE